MSTSRYAWFVAGMLAIAYLLSTMDRYLLSVVLDDLKVSLNLTDTQLGVLQGPSFVLLYMLASIPLGRLADVASRRWIIAGGLACWSLATAACGLANSFNELVVARLAVGLGEASLLPSAMSLIAAYFSRDKLSRGLAVYSIGGSLGRAAAFAGGGALFAWFAANGGVRMFGSTFAPWQSVFLTAGVIGVGVAVLFLLTVREPPRTRVAGKEGAMRAGFSHFGRRWLPYLAVFIPFSMTTAVTAQLGAWAVSFYTREHGLSVPAASALIGLTGLAIGPVGALFGGWLNDALRRRGHANSQPLVLAAVLILVTACVVAFVFTPWVVAAAAVYGLAYFFLCWTMPTGLSGVQLLTPERHRGIISSLFLVFYTALGTGAGPLIVGMFSDALRGQGGLGLAMLSATVVLSAVGVAVALVGQKAFRTAASADEGA